MQHITRRPGDGVLTGTLRSLGRQVIGARPGFGAAKDPGRRETANVRRVATGFTAFSPKAIEEKTRSVSALKWRITALQTATRLPRRRAAEADAGEGTRYDGLVYVPSERKHQNPLVSSTEDSVLPSKEAKKAAGIRQVHRVYTDKLPVCVSREVAVQLAKSQGASVRLLHSVVQR
ncbi:hypothetical protein SKAU_G00130100 [Synaphobranchus kaupii]|uniref:Uncharacterized protein n=1 Tax=Synaphobranchus kaupii TaxID=118154 RepID=A0A9Q1FQG0_SYNKA|nr:hypothetical protein SKAU_G00130100 [Synaphobranchus kaupii]